MDQITLAMFLSCISLNSTSGVDIIQRIEERVQLLDLQLQLANIPKAIQRTTENTTGFVLGSCGYMQYVCGYMQYVVRF